MAIESLSMRTNVFSLFAQKAMAKTEHVFGTTMARLSSGMRINKAADDAAGLSVSEKMRAQIRGFAQAQRNAKDGVSLLQTAEGAMGEIADMLIRQRELAVQSANGTLGTDERRALHAEFNHLRSEITRISRQTTFNNIRLLDGSFSNGVDFQVGLGNNVQTDRITVTLAGATATTIGITQGITLTTVTGSQTSIALVDSAIQSIANQRGDIGAFQNRFDVTIANLQTMHENLSASRSRIADTDVAAETSVFTSAQIVMQAGLSVLSQANQLPSMALTLISGGR